MICPKCGAENNSNSKYCNSCGTEISRTSKLINQLDNGKYKEAIGTAAGSAVSLIDKKIEEKNAKKQKIEEEKRIQREKELKEQEWIKKHFWQIIIAWILMVCIMVFVGMKLSEKETEETNKSSTSVNSGSVVMPKSSIDYCTSEWTLNSLKAELTDLGFKNIEEIPCDPSSTNYHKEIFEVYVHNGLLSETTNSWEAGEEISTEDKISIYYNEFPMLTIENCEDLKTVLYTKEMTWESFIEKYDNRYVSFDGYITCNIEHAGSHVIHVSGTPDIAGLELFFDVDKIVATDINEDLQEGQYVHVEGLTEDTNSEFYDMVFLKGMVLTAN